jgi:hypothetical protein
VTNRRALLVCLLASRLTRVAFAQGAPFRIRGTIDAVDAKTLHLTTRGGEKRTLALASDLVVTAIVSASITDIKTGSYIGTAAVAQPDGSLRALEVQVFPEAMRGVGEGHRPWDLGSGSTMTNGTVGDVAGIQGRTLTLRYKGGEQRVAVPVDVPVITYEPGARAMLAPGAHVIVTALREADGSLVAQRIGVGKDGLTPPM